MKWEIMASMEDVQKAHPDWTEEQCREEFNRIAEDGLKKMLDQEEARKTKRKRKQPA